MKIVRFCIVLVLLSSCKKNYNCECKTIVNYWGGSENFISSAQPLEKRYTKKQAQAICEREGTAIDQTYNNVFSNNGAWSTNGVYARTTCNLK
jgi:hypothetical protein